MLIRNIIGTAHREDSVRTSPNGSIRIGCTVVCQDFGRMLLEKLLWYGILFCIQKVFSKKVSIVKRFGSAGPYHLVARDKASATVTACNAVNDTFGRQFIGSKDANERTLR